MKNQFFTILLFFTFIINATPNIIYVQTPFNQTMPFCKTETPATIFLRCRQQQLCYCPANSLTLLFGRYEIKEGTERSHTKRLIDFGVCSNEAFITQPSSQPVVQPAPVLGTPQIVTKVPTGEFLYFSPYETFAQVFRRCREIRACWKEKLEIVYNNHSIVEGSNEAEYCTLASFGPYAHTSLHNPAILIQKGLEDLSFTELMTYLFFTPHNN